MSASLMDSPNVSTMDQTPTSHPPSANASPRPRRRRAHTAHAEVEEDAAAAERRRRRCVMEEQLLSLESMQQANQERLRRQAQGAQPTTPQLSLEGGGANESFTSPTLSSPHLTGTPVTSSSATTTAGGRMVIPPKASKYLPQHEIAVLSASGLSSGGVGPAGEVSPNAFLRHHTTVVWSDKYDTMEGSPSPTKDQLTRSPVLGSRQKDASGLRGSLERSSSAVVMPSDAPRRSTIAPNMLPPSPFHASPPGGATRGGATGAAGAAVAQHHRDPMVRVANTSPLHLSPTGLRSA
ncbi:Hypothetical protein, putative [Bodo saltans]|uniref:Uncharacterized protein n=1 Tax=Bodo saltans TaxID=75058 RepID=A0A0S4JM62_BODSA|nr:Hypothetical protein, putative [Bodo saltans]|eukprot:CUG91723.1 Hypothetical protein, putative [Bodo saltans]